MNCSTQDAELIVTYSLADLAPSLAVGLLLVAVGTLLARNRLVSRPPDYAGGKIGGIGLGMIFFGALLLLAFVPSQYGYDRIVLRSDGLCIDDDYWFVDFPPRHIDFHNIRGLRSGIDPTEQRVLHAYYRDGRRVTIPLHSLWRKKEATIAAALAAHGIPLHLQEAIAADD